MKIAVVANTGLGDALLMMILAKNLSLEGHEVTLYSDLIIPLAPLFPQISLQKYPSVEELYATLDTFQHTIIQEHGPGSKAIPKGMCKEYPTLPKRVFVIYKDSLDPTQTYASNLQKLCKEKYHIENATIGSGIEIPAVWSYRKVSKRVILHPTSANEQKNWPKKKFIVLAQNLKKRGFEPFFVLPSKEALEWKESLQEAALSEALSLDFLSLAKLLYESGYFIGNDGSIGHLASSLGIPTLSIFDRASRASLWRPGWGENRVVLPYPICVSRQMRKRFWKYFLPVSRVEAFFLRQASSF